MPLTKKNFGETLSVRLKDGLHSDIEVSAFGKSYKLHKLLLRASGYFNNLFDGSWNDSTGVHKLSLEGCSKYITDRGFKYCIDFLYGVNIIFQEGEYDNFLDVIETAQYLDIPELVRTATLHVICTFSMSNIASYLDFAYEGDCGVRIAIIHSIVNLLCNSGWEADINNWIGIPPDVIRRALSSDAFFVPNEWERVLFLIKLSFAFKHIVDHEEWPKYHKVFKELFKYHIYYTNLSSPQLNTLQEYSEDKLKDLDILDAEVIRKSLWQQGEIQRRIIKTTGLKVGFCENQIFRKDSTMADICKKGKSVVNQDFSFFTGTLDSIERRILQNNGNKSKDLTKYSTDESIDKIYHVSSVPPLRCSIVINDSDKLSEGMNYFYKAGDYLGNTWWHMISRSKVGSKKGKSNVSYFLSFHKDTPPNINYFKFKSKPVILVTSENQIKEFESSEGLSSTELENYGRQARMLDLSDFNKDSTTSQFPLLAHDSRSTLSAVYGLYLHITEENVMQYKGYNHDYIETIGLGTLSVFQSKKNECTGSIIKGGTSIKATMVLNIF
ncbi:hypothetical protein CAAN1_19S00584 [[Candida] anglica]|uniref:BTB domain-containing protein n=1 Tax=[Candida] anglica TaxID=148631 RepID=A0ABP0E7T2_9ASCO